MHATPADHARARALIKAGSKSFYAASLLLPAEVRRGASALYAFCRVSDDLVDVEGGSERAVAHLRRRLESAYAGRPIDNPIDRAFADTVARFAIPHALPEALIDGLAWDVQGVVCHTLEDVLAYSARVAGSVGAMMACLLEVRGPDMVARACDLGLAMQLTNIARDVGEDARAGRLYLPRDWMTASGVDPAAFLAGPTFTPALGGVVTRLLDVADTLYARADAAIARLPDSGRAGVRAARLLYAEIGHALRRAGSNSVDVRTVVARPVQIARLGAALFDPHEAPGLLAAPPEASVRFLVDAAAIPGAPTPGAALSPWGKVDAKVGWVIDLFADLDAREPLRRRGV